MSAQRSKKISLKKLPEFNTIWHEESRLVFKSKEDAVVIGKLDGGKIQPLKEEDIVTCEKLRLKYEIVLLKKEKPAEEEVEEEEEEVEEDAVDENAEEEVEENAEEEAPEEEAEEIEETEEVEEEATEEVQEVEEEIEAEPAPVKETLAVEVKPTAPISFVINETVAVSNNNEDDVFSKSIQVTMDIWKKTINQKNDSIATLEKNLKQNISVLNALQVDHKTLEAKYNTLQDNFDKMKVKFDSIQKLFA